MSPHRRGLATLQAISQRAHLNLSTLNYYANLGLLHAIDRKGNTRLFSEGETCRRLQKIKRFRRRGYPLRIIREQLKEEGAAP